MLLGVCSVVTQGGSGTVFILVRVVLNVVFLVLNVRASLFLVTVVMWVDRWGLKWTILLMCSPCRGSVSVC